MPNFSSSRTYTSRPVIITTVNVGYKSLFGRVDVHNQNSKSISLEKNVA